jgi:hypothetical protein
LAIARSVAINRSTIRGMTTSAGSEGLAAFATRRLCTKWRKQKLLAAVGSVYRGDYFGYGGAPWRKAKWTKLLANARPCCNRTWQKFIIRRSPPFTGDLFDQQSRWQIGRHFADPARTRRGGSIDVRRLSYWSRHRA